MFYLKRLFLLSLAVSIASSGYAQGLDHEEELKETFAIQTREIHQVMAAASNYLTIQADEKETEAKELDRWADLGDSLSINGSASEIEGFDRSQPKGQSKTKSPRDNFTLGGGVSLSFSLTTYFSFQQKGLQIEVAEAELQAKRMELAAKAGATYLRHRVKRSTYGLYTCYAEELKNALDDLTSLSSLSRARLTNAIASSFENPGISNLEESRKAKNALRVYIDGFEPKPLPRIITQRQGGSCGQTLLEYPEDFLSLMRNAYGFSKTFFAIPPTREEAIALSGNNPTRISARLKEDISVNAWYLSIARLGPTLTLSFNYSDSESSFSENEGYSINGSLSFNLPGGLPLRVKAADVRSEGSELIRMDTDLNVNLEISDRYDEMDSLISRHGVAVSKLEQILLEIRELRNPGATEGLSEVDKVNNLIGAFSNLAATVQEINTISMDTINKQIEIKALIGNLVDDTHMWMITEAPEK